MERKRGRKTPQFAGLQGRRKNPSSISSSSSSLDFMSRLRNPLHQQQPLVLGIPSMSSQKRMSWNATGNHQQQPPELLSQLTFSQGSVLENHVAATMDTSNDNIKSRSQTSNYLPPLHQNSSISSASSSSLNKKISLTSVRFGTSPPSVFQQMGKKDSSSAISRNNNNEKKRNSISGTSQFLSRLNPRRIGGKQNVKTYDNTSANFKPPGSFSFSTRIKPPPALCPMSSSKALSMTSAASSTATSTASNSESLSAPPQQIATTKRHLLSSEATKQQFQLLQAELKDYVETSRTSLDEKFKEIFLKEDEVDAKLRKFQVQQDESNEKLLSIDSTLDLKYKDLNQLVEGKTLAMERQANLRIQNIDTAGQKQLETLQNSFKTSMRKIKEAAQGVNVIADSFTQRYDQAIEAIPSHIKPIIMKMIDSLYAKAQEKMIPAVVATCKDTPSITDKPLQPEKRSFSRKQKQTNSILHELTQLPKTATRSSSRKRKQSSTSSNNNSNLKESDKFAPSTTKQRRSKRTKDDSRDKENKTPSSKMIRPCVTPPGEAPKHDRRVSLLNSKKKKAKKPLLSTRKANKSADPALRPRKRRLSGHVEVIFKSSSSATSTATKNRIPVEVVITDNTSKSLSPLKSPSMGRDKFKQVSSYYPTLKEQRVPPKKISLPQGSSKRVKRKTQTSRRTTTVGSKRRIIESPDYSFSFR